jgi:hypothetical protein
MLVNFEILDIFWSIFFLGFKGILVILVVLLIGCILKNGLQFFLGLNQFHNFYKGFSSQFKIFSV